MTFLYLAIFVLSLLLLACYRIASFLSDPGLAISLPSLGVAGGKMAAMLTSAYARIRTQLDVPIGYFGGVGEPLARIGSRTYQMDATRLLTLVALDQGEQPGVLSAINKY